MSWTKREEKELVRLCKGDLFATEIAEKLRKKPQIVRYKMRVLGISPADRARDSGRMAKWNKKHAHLRERAMKFFMTHTFEQTRDKFGLSSIEIKSLMTAGYMDPKFSHLRKDTRRNDVWSFEETMFLLKHCGLQPRDWIAGKIKRGTMQSSKEMLSRLKIKSRYVNGLPKRLAEELIGRNIDSGIKVKAGPTAPGVDCRPIIVPWVILYSEAKKSSLELHFVEAIGALARFQKKIHGTRGILDTVESVQAVVNKR